MQGLSALRVAHCCPSFGGRLPSASPSPRHHLLLLGFQQHRSFFRCRRDAFAVATRGLKASSQILQDGSATEDVLTPLAQEDISTKLAEEEVPMKDVVLEEGPKVNVKFILEKKCYFGQRFNVVGNHPLLGNWKVEAAIPMEWAEGDIWAAEVDVPAEREFEFKFVLTGEIGDIEWQPGSNRVFKTANGISPLVVKEAWKSVEDVVAAESVGKSSDLVEDTTSSDTAGLLVAADIMEDAAVDEVVQALESKVGKDTPKAEPETTPEIPLAELDAAATAVKTALGVDAAKNGEDKPKAEPETTPEIPLAELDVAVTAVKTALGVDDAA